MKLTTALENFRGRVVSDDLSFAPVEINKNCWLTLPRWKSLCHRLSREQPQPGSFFERAREAEKKDPGNEVGRIFRVRFVFVWFRESSEIQRFQRIFGLRSKCLGKELPPLSNFTHKAKKYLQSVEKPRYEFSATVLRISLQ